MVKNNFSENLKLLKMKKWAKFAGKTEKYGRFMVIASKKTLKVNNLKNEKMKFNPFKFPAFG